MLLCKFLIIRYWWAAGRAPCSSGTSSLWSSSTHFKASLGSITVAENPPYTVVPQIFSPRTLLALFLPLLQLFYSFDKKKFSLSFVFPPFSLTFPSFFVFSHKRKLLDTPLPRGRRVFVSYMHPFMVYKTLITKGAGEFNFCIWQVGRVKWGVWSRLQPLMSLQ